MERHGAEFLAADNAADPQKLPARLLSGGFFHGFRLDHADQSALFVHHWHAKQVVFLE
ncbi:MAG: hypothetical protein IH621_07005, partial [Krumholzibacteria bacterium]|nr:hypothetical protein [Candidatus Krumholzibacteria bacterium]